MVPATNGSNTLSRDRVPRPPHRWMVGVVTSIILLLCAHGVWGLPLDAVLRRGRYDAQEKREITAAVNQAAEAGIPSEFLIPRIKEAAAKRISAVRLLEALTTEVTLLKHARVLLQNVPDSLRTDGVWQRTGTLLAWGAVDNEISNLVVASGGKPDRYAAVTSLFVSLIDWGLEREGALALSVSVAVSSLQNGDFPGITRLLADARRRQERTDLAAERLIGLLADTATLRELEERIRYD